MGTSTNARRLDFSNCDLLAFGTSTQDIKCRAPPGVKEGPRKQVKKSTASPNNSSSSDGIKIRQLWGNNSFVVANCHTLHGSSGTSHDWFVYSQEHASIISSTLNQAVVYDLAQYLREKTQPQDTLPKSFYIKNYGLDNTSR